MAKICENICKKNVVILKFFLTLLHEQMIYQNCAVIMSNREILEMLLPAMVNAAVRAGAAIMQIHGHKDDYDISLKSDKTPITMADRQAHRVIREALGSTRIPILSEEGREMGYEERRNWELYWLVDPLDGTAEFIEGYNEFTVNIALMENNQCVGAVIYVPYFEKIYLAGSGYGASLKEGVAASADAAWSLEQILQGCKSLPLVEQAPHDHLRVAVSRLHYTPETEAHIDALRQKYPDLEIVEQGSSYKFCMLAEGTIDYYVRTSRTYEWDTAAGELILSEAGGSTCVMADGSRLRYNEEDLSNPWFIGRSRFSPI